MDSGTSQLIGPELDRLPWDAVLGSRALQHTRDFMAFRAVGEPGDYGFVVDTVDGVLRAGMPLFATTADTALFSDPWKLLTAAQYRRSEVGDVPEAELADRHDALVAAVAGGTGPESLRAAIGEVAVSRFFDESDVLADPTLDAADADAAVDRVLTHAQSLVRAGRFGALALPFVAAGNHALRARLRRFGFRGGMLTAQAAIGVPAGTHTLADWVAGQSKSTRRRFRQESAAFDRLGLRLVRLPTDQATLARVAELEVQTLGRHGGHGDPAGIAALRRWMVDRFGDRLQLTGVLDGARLVACGVDLIGAGDFHGMTYGCDYSRPMLDSVYAQVCYWSAIANGIDHGVRQLRYGFEAFEPKVLRGAELTGLELWLWTPDERTGRALGELLAFLDGRTRRHLARWPVRLPEPLDDGHGG